MVWSHWWRYERESWRFGSWSAWAENPDEEARQLDVFSFLKLVFSSRHRNRDWTDGFRSVFPVLWDDPVFRQSTPRYWKRKRWHLSLRMCRSDTPYTLQDCEGVIVRECKNSFCVLLRLFFAFSRKFFCEQTQKHWNIHFHVPLVALYNYSDRCWLFSCSSRSRI